jgi:hypothetical protein
MLDERQRINAFLVLGASVITTALFVAGYFAPGQWSAVLLGIGSSIAAVLLLTVIASFQLALLEHRKVRFFGPTLVRGQSVFVCPDFEIQNGNDSSPAQLVRTTGRERESLLPPGAAGNGIGQLPTYARADIMAAVRLGTLFDSSPNAPHSVIPDSGVMASRPRNIRPANTTGYMSIGLSTNDVTLAYVNDPSSLLQLQFSAEHGSILRPRGRLSFYNTSDRVYGACVRLAAAPGNTTDFIFICGGMGTDATTAVAQYLVTNWQRLARRVGRSEEFVAIISQSSLDGSIELEGVFTLNGG